MFEFFNRSKKCLDDEASFSYLTGVMHRRDRARAEKHLRTCEPCRAKMTELMDMLSGRSTFTPSEKDKIRPYGIGRWLSLIRFQNQQRSSRASFLTRVAHLAPSWALRLGSFRVPAPSWAGSILAGLALLTLIVIIGWHNLHEKRSSDLYTQGKKLLFNYDLYRASNLKLTPLFGQYFAITRSEGPDQNEESKGLNEAQTHFSKALGASPGHLLSHLGLGYTYLFKKYPEEASKEFQEAARIDNKNIHALNGLGIALFETAQKQKSILRENELLTSSLAYFDSVLEENPKQREALYNKAFVYYELGEREKTLVVIEKYLQEDSTSEWAHDLLSLQERLKLSSYPLFQDEFERALDQQSPRIKRIG